MHTAIDVPEIVGCYFDDRFSPHLPVMRLRWPEADEANETCWELPEGVRMTGGPPDRFGIQVRRLGRDSYSVRLVWNDAYLTWFDLTRVQLLTSGLSPLLGVLGTDLYALLDQAVSNGKPTRPRAA